MLQYILKHETQLSNLLNFEFHELEMMFECCLRRSQTQVNSLECLGFLQKVAISSCNLYLSLFRCAGWHLKLWKRRPYQFTHIGVKGFKNSNSSSFCCWVKKKALMADSNFNRRMRMFCLDFMIKAKKKTLFFYFKSFIIQFLFHSLLNWRCNNFKSTPT